MPVETTSGLHHLPAAAAVERVQLAGAVLVLFRVTVGLVLRRQLPGRPLQGAAVVAVLEHCRERLPDLVDLVAVEGAVF
jgi:hypothetical protein